MEKNIKVGIGFATGRKSFKKVLKTYVFNWRESGLTENDKVRLNLFVAYDLKYLNTKREDYINLSSEVRDLIDDTYFIGSSIIQKEIDYLIDNNIINESEAQILFSNGYAGKRNAVLYLAIKHNMDYLLFLDDDEYPIAVTKNRSNVIWGGQQVLLTHLNNIKNADITNGFHCGYISPIPYIEFNEDMTESDFRQFIEVISNDIINWNSIHSIMNNGGVTYANTDILVNGISKEVEEVNSTKFISGANLCINLTRPERVNPFYNPPGARGEDTFLSTCLSRRKVMRVPCYAFHDGFSTYNHLMDGVLPTKLRYIKADTEQIINRFYNACIGWIRYRPLLLYITQRDNYQSIIKNMQEQLEISLPKVSGYFGKKNFINITKELNRYHNNVESHYMQFLNTQQAWKKITDFLSVRN